MTSILERPLPEGFERTCWQGMVVTHPAEWEAGRLSGPGEPLQCIFIDRRFQRLQVNWQAVKAEPDLKRMYAQLGAMPAMLQACPEDKTCLQKRKHGTQSGETLAGAPEWTGLVRKEAQGTLVYAGRYFPAGRRLVQVVLVWPGARDGGVERAVLAGIGPFGDADPVPWQALGLSATVPKGFELTDSASPVGRVTWGFARAVKPPAGLKVERIAMVRQWLPAATGDGPEALAAIEKWLKAQAPKGSHLAGDGKRGHSTFPPARPAGRGPGGEAGAADRVPPSGGKVESPLLPHAGVEVVTWEGSVAQRLARRCVWRRARAWYCPTDERLYHLAYWQRGAAAPDWPEGVTVRCCGTRP